MSSTSKPQNIIEKIWDEHVVVQKEGHPAVLGIDLQLIHEVTSPQAFEMLREKNLPVKYPGKLVATLDHAIPTRLDRDNIFDEVAKKQVETLRQNVVDFGVPFYDFGSGNQGIVHVLGPDLGITQPGLTIICGDSHTATHGAFGALAFGVGTTEVGLMMATGCILQDKPKTMKVEFTGHLPKGVFSKDMILKLISLIGIGGGNGHIFEYTGTAIADLSMEARMSICNMSIEAGARGGLISPDKKTIDYLKTRKITTKISSGDLDRIVEELRLPLKIHGQPHTKANIVTQQLILRLLNLGRKFILISSYPHGEALLKQVADSSIAWVQDLSALASNLDKPIILFEGSILDNIQPILGQIEPDRIVVLLNLENLPIAKNLANIEQLNTLLQPLLRRRNLILAGDWTNLEWLDFEFNSELQFSSYKNQLMPELNEYEVLWTLCEPRPFRPKDEDWDRAVEYWLSLRSDPGCQYDRELVIDVNQLEPMITWGTNPGEGIPITGTVPYIDELPPDSRNNAKKSLEYTKLQEGQKLLGLPVDFVFMGSCTNSRIEDLRIVAKIMQGKKVAKGVTMYVVPGSEAVRKQAELEGLDQIFKEAGAEWRMPGCSMCLGMNDDKVPAGKRCVATSNRNFMNRQGPGAITHLASPATAAATAITGVITDPRTVL